MPARPWHLDCAPVELPQSENTQGNMSAREHLRTRSAARTPSALKLIDKHQRHNHTNVARYH